MPRSLGTKILVLTMLAWLAGCAGVDNRTTFSVDDPPWLSPRHKSLYHPSAPQNGVGPVDPRTPGSARGAPADPAAPAPLFTPTTPVTPTSPPEGPQLMPIEADDRGVEPSSGTESPPPQKTSPPQVEGPRLDLEVEAPSGRQVGAGATFQLTVRNSGKADAVEVAVDCEFDDAFVFPGRQEKRVRQTLGRLPAGESSHMALTLSSQREGQHCCRFSVVNRGVEAVWKSVCVTYSDKQLDVSIIGPPRRSAGSRAEFTVKVLNPSRQPIDGVNARLAYDRGVLTPREGTAGAVREPGSMRWNIGLLQPGEGVQLQAELECSPQAAQTVVGVEAAGQAMPTEYRRANLAIAPDNGNLHVEIEERSDLVKVGKEVEYVITATNRGREPARAVRLAGRLPSNLTFLSGQAECSDAKTTVHRTGQAGLQFANIASLPPGQSVRFTIRARAVQTGDGWVTASARQGNGGAPTELFEPTTVNE